VTLFESKRARSASQGGRDEGFVTNGSEVGIDVLRAKRASPLAAPMMIGRNAQLVCVLLKNRSRLTRCFELRVRVVAVST
jgi:hypothetical protein